MLALNRTRNKSILFTIVLCIVVLICNQSCRTSDDDGTDLPAFDQLNDEGAIEAAIVSVYRAYVSVVQYPEKYHLTSNGADDITSWCCGGKPTLRMFDGFNYGDGRNSDNAALLEMWQHLWATIYETNFVLKGLEHSKAPAGAVNKGRAEARFFRALCYFDLVRVFGNVPLVIEPVSIDSSYQRATVLENYKLIEDDLKVAEEYLPMPGEVGTVGRVSCAAAKANLANLYLTWAGWPLKDNTKYRLAAQKAREVIELNYFELLPIDQLWLLESENSRESVFSVQFSKADDLRSDYPASFSFHESRGWSSFFPERQFFYNFPEGPRKDITFYTEIPQREFNSTLGIIVDRDPPTVHWTQSQRNHPMYKKYDIGADLTVRDRLVGYRAVEIIRYSEVLLIYAEAQAMEHGGALNTGALEALNQVRRRAAGNDYLTPDPTVDLSNANAFEVLQERGWEFAGENKRWFDLVRTEKVAEIVAQRDPTEEIPLYIPVGELSWKQFIAPIPHIYAIPEGSLKQNPEGFRIN